MHKKFGGHEEDITIKLLTLAHGFIMKITKNKRKHERYFLEIPVRLSFTRDSGKELIFDLKTNNISAGGAFFKTKEQLPIPLKTKVKLILKIAIEKLIKVEGKGAVIEVYGMVIRISTEGMAVCFDSKYKIFSLPHA